MKVHDLKAAERVKLARSQDRPVVDEYAEALFQELTLFSGDRCYGEDASVLGGVGLFHGRPVTVIGHRKGRDLEENLRSLTGTVTRVRQTLNENSGANSQSNGVVGW